MRPISTVGNRALERRVAKINERMKAVSVKQRKHVPGPDAITYARQLAKSYGVASAQRAAWTMFTEAALPARQLYWKHVGDELQRMADAA